MRLWGAARWDSRFRRELWTHTRVHIGILFISLLQASTQTPRPDAATPRPLTARHRMRHRLGSRRRLYTHRVMRDDEPVAPEPVGSLVQLDLSRHGTHSMHQLIVNASPPLSPLGCHSHGHGHSVRYRAAPIIVTAPAASRAEPAAWNAAMRHAPHAASPHVTHTHTHAQCTCLSVHNCRVHTPQATETASSSHQQGGSRAMLSSPPRDSPGT